MINNLIVGKANQRQKVGGVLGLDQIETISREGNFKPQKIAKISMIFQPYQNNKQERLCPVEKEKDEKLKQKKKQR